MEEIKKKMSAFLTVSMLYSILHNTATLQKGVFMVGLVTKTRVIGYGNRSFYGGLYHPNKQ
jgi:hypothetical protein